MKKINLSSKKKFLIGWLAFLVANLIIILVTLLVKAAKPAIGIEPWSSQAWSGAGLFLIKTVYVSNFLAITPILLATIVFTGYMIIGRGIKDSFLGALKTAIGFLLLGIGSGALVGLAKPVFEAVRKLGSSAEIIPLDPYFSLSQSQDFLARISEVIKPGIDYSSLFTFTLLIAFIVNIIFVAGKRWTNTNSLMITGHIMLQQSAVVTSVLYVLLFRQIPIVDGELSAGSQAGLVLISGLFLGIYWATATTATLKPTNLVTQNAGFAVGHQQMLGILTSYKLGRFFGKKEDTAENRKLPSYLKIFEDNIFTQTLIIFVLFVILFIVIIQGSSKPVLNENLIGFTKDSGLSSWNGNLYGGANFIFNIIGGALKIVAALLVIITGVRMFITELQQSFHGISEKIIPGAVVAVDVAATYGFSINSVTYGFVSGVIGQFLAVGIMIGVSAIPGNSYSNIAIPLFITLFFNSGSLGIYANASGGWKAAAIVPGLIGFLEIITISFATKFLSNVAIADGLNNPVAQGYIGMSDWNLFFGLLIIIGAYSVPVAWIFVFIAITALILLAQIIDSGNQTKKTHLQKLFKIKVDNLEQAFEQSA
ncbi:PTS ascorbate transporter subunit IIC [Mycoplasma sp. 1654_15]|uniref:PTS ascorbate transporter subunit IIC n=1 Tax=Mycoplasma sp. 1654_15 TaxID=2725994 RepID=UPI001449C85C|nr:PTS ascorbate transporter subunit IIC [Mycoplasma sp. 1654_15]QJB71146.1 PTS ascorbate transporter subunit IIC [Mycoplasma sp. 1654_15]